MTAGVATGLLLATLFRLNPHLVGSTWGLWLGFLIVFVLPGFMLLHILYPHDSNLGIAELPALFVLNLALWAIPAGLLEFTHSNWDRFQEVFLLVLWAEGVLFVIRQARAPRMTFSVSARSLAIGLTLLALGILVGVVVYHAPRNKDDWFNLAVVQQLIRQDGFTPVIATDARYALRFTFQVWLFLQAFVSRWFGGDALTLSLDFSPAAVCFLSLLALYGWAKEFTGKSWAALVAVLFQLAIYVLSGQGGGWGHGFFIRSAEDKFLVWLLILPITLLFFWRYMQRGAWPDLVACALTVLATVFVHPIETIQALLVIGGFALFNLLLKNSFPRRRWAIVSLGAVLILVVLLFTRVMSSPALFSIAPSPSVTQYLYLNRNRLVLLTPSLYIAHPNLIAQPLILLAVGLLPFMIPYLRKDRRAQFLWGGTLVPLALLFNPYTAFGIGQLITPWQIWRLTWVLPVSLIFADLVTRLDLGQLAVLRSHSGQSSIVRLRAPTLSVALVAALAFLLAPLNVSASLKAIATPHTPAPPVESLMRALPGLLSRPSVILVPVDLLRYPTAYWGYALLPSPTAYWANDPVLPKINQFYASTQYTPQVVQFLNERSIDFVVLKVHTPLDDQIRARLQYFAPRYSNGTYVLYQVLLKPLPLASTSGG
jgi:hypothetical protein